MATAGAADLTVIPRGAPEARQRLDAIHAGRLLSVSADETVATMNLDLEGCRVLVRWQQWASVSPAPGISRRRTAVAIARAPRDLAAARAALGQVLTVAADLADAARRIA